MSCIEIKDLKKYFPVGNSLLSRGRKMLKAVDGVSLQIRTGETQGIAGESGSGKTTLGRLILRLIEPTAGTIYFMGEKISEMSRKEFQPYRTKMQIIFQNPISSLNLRQTILQILAKPLKFHKIVEKDKIKGKVIDLLETVDLTPAASFLKRFPHELSGGQKQRVALSRALSLGSKFIVADEPVSALDVSIRSDILRLMKNLQKDLDLTYLFITHDLAVLRSISERVAIMYLGKILELAKVADLFNQPMHPYTKALLAATPVPNPRLARTRESLLLVGDVPSSIELPPGCRFNERCPFKQAGCQTEQEPELEEVKDDHFVACFRAMDIE